MIHYNEQKTGDFAVYSNRFAQSPELSFEAKAVLRYLLSRPDNWNTCKNALKNALGVGRCVIDRLAQELVTSGHLLPRGGTYVVLEDPALLERAGELGSGIVRFKRNERTCEFSIIDNAPFLNCSIPLRARGVLCYLLTLPEDWEVHVPAVAKAGTESYKLVAAAIKDLIREGYITRTAKRVGNRNCGWNIDVYEAPLRPADNQIGCDSESRLSEKEHVVSTNNTQKIEKQNPPNPQKGKVGGVAQSDVDVRRKSFELLAAEYPVQRRGNVVDAFGEYQQALDSTDPVPNIPTLIEAVRALVRSDQWTVDDGKYIPWLRNWIRDRQWFAVVSLPETVAVTEWSPEEILATAHKKVKKRLKRQNDAGSLEELTPLVYQQAALSCVSMPAWAQYILTGGHDSVLPRCSDLLAGDLADTPGLQEFLEREHRGLLDAVEEYREGCNEPAR